jgi:putative tricarboxylic transport membrane protein
MLAALLLFGIQPGPRLFETNPEIVWPVIASLYLGNVALLVLNLPLIPLWVRLLKIPYWVLYPAILVLAVVGAYSVRGSMFDIYLLIFFSVLGYAFRKLSIPPTPLLMAFVLGPQAENAIRQSLTLSDNSPLIFVERPISAIVLCLALIVVALAIYSRRRGTRLPTKDAVLLTPPAPDPVAEMSTTGPAQPEMSKTREVNQ